MSIEAYAKKINKYIIDKSSKTTSKPSRGLLSPRQIKSRPVESEDIIQKIGDIVNDIREKRMQLKEKGADRG